VNSGKLIFGAAELKSAPLWQKRAFIGLPFFATPYMLQLDFHAEPEGKNKIQK
jgi:hypothetical protein